MDKVKDRKYFTKLDIQWGYNNVRIKEGDEWKAAFKTNQSLYKPMVMFFRMCNSLATFQAMMDDIFEDLIEKRIIWTTCSNQLKLKNNFKTIPNRFYND